jgi:hypothetical protein
MNSSLYRPHLLSSHKLRLPKQNFPGSAKEKKKIANLIGVNVKSCKNDSDAEEDEEDEGDVVINEEDEQMNNSSDSSLPEVRPQAKGKKIILTHPPRTGLIATRLRAIDPRG